MTAHVESSGEQHIRRLMVSEFITLDGVVEAPGGEPGHPNTGWVFDYHGPELEPWSNSSLLAGDLATAVTELKQGDGGPILVHGSATLAQASLTAGLVDDLRLMVSPVLVGGGRRIFPGSFQKPPSHSSSRKRCSPTS
jgi:dihydrofolate reductase